MQVSGYKETYGFLKKIKTNPCGRNPFVCCQCFNAMVYYNGMCQSVTWNGGGYAGDGKQEFL